MVSGWWLVVQVNLLTLATFNPKAQARLTTNN
jgi:hypothetical protein